MEVLISSVTHLLCLTGNTVNYLRNYPKLMASQKQRPLLPAKSESNRGRLFWKSKAQEITFIMVPWLRNSTW